MTIDVPAALHEAVEDLVRLGLFGATVPEVVVYLVRRGIDDLVRSGVLTLPSDVDGRLGQ